MKTGMYFCIDFKKNHVYAKYVEKLRKKLTIYEIMLS